MIKIIRIFLLFTGLICAGFAQANSNNKLHKEFLAHNQNTGAKAKGNKLILNAKSNKKVTWVYVIENKSKKTIYINHPADHPGTASAGWGTRLDAQKWTAIMLDRPNFAITCQNGLTGNPQSVVACKKVLKVSRFKPHSNNTNKQGSYWIGENQSLDKLLQTLNVRGIGWK